MKIYEHQKKVYDCLSSSHENVIKLRHNILPLCLCRISTKAVRGSLFQEYAEKRTKYGGAHFYVNITRYKSTGSGSEVSYGKCAVSA